MKQQVILITCDDDKTKATSMHEIKLVVDGKEFDFDACSQGCAVRLVHNKLVEVLEAEAFAERRRRSAPPETPDQSGDDPPPHPDDDRMRDEVRD